MVTYRKPKVIVSKLVLAILKYGNRMAMYTPTFDGG